MDKRHFAFDRTNFILLAVSMVVIIIGFILMSGSPSTEEFYNPDIFSVRRIKVAPVVCLVGFVMMIYAVLHSPKTKETAEDKQMDTLQDSDEEANSALKAASNDTND